MSYTATTPVAPIPFSNPRGSDFTQKNQTIRGNLFQYGGTVEYAVGGVGSTSFEVTDITTLGVVTYSNLVGLPLVNGQKVVIGSVGPTGTNAGIKTISAVTVATASTGTFQIDTFNGTHDASLTVEGVGQIQFAEKQNVAQAFTVATVTAGSAGANGTFTFTYSGLTGPQLQVGQSVTLACSKAANTGTFVVKTVTPSTIAAGSVVVYATGGGASTDTGTGAAFLAVGVEAIQTAQPPTEVLVWSTKPSAFVYTFNPLSQTVQVLTASAELAVGTTWSFDTIQFVAVFPKAATV
jgi:hypothetical protein